MVLTSQAHRRCTPRTNRKIPTIPAGNIDGRLVHVSAVDTGPRRSGSGVLGGTARRLRHRSTPAPCPLRRGPEAMVRRLLRPESARVGLLHEGRDLLTTGCAYCTKAPPTRSTPNPPPVAPHPRAVHPDDTGGHAVDADSNDYRLLRSPGRRLGQRRAVSEAGAVGAHLEGDPPALGLRGEALNHGDERLRLVQTRKRLQGEQVDPLPRQDLGQQIRQPNWLALQGRGRYRKRSHCDTVSEA